MSKVKATARVQLTLDIETDSWWGEDCGLAQIFTQASREGVEKVERMLGKHRIIGTPKVVVVLLDKKEAE